METTDKWPVVYPLLGATIHKSDDQENVKTWQNGMSVHPAKTDKLLIVNCCNSVEICNIDPDFRLSELLQYFDTTLPV